MKKTKKLLSILLAATMTLAMAAPTFADDPTTTDPAPAETEEVSGSITLDNPAAGKTYTAYKIFDVVYNEDKTAYSYTIEDDLSDSSDWYDVVKSYEGIKLTKTANDNNLYIVERTEKFSAPNFANLLKSNIKGKNGTALTDDDNDGKVSAPLSLGYYFVFTNSGALCNLTTTEPDITIHDKNDVPFTKTDDAADVEIGQDVNYTIVGKVPDTTGFTTYTYQVADTMSNGLTFKNDVKVYLGLDEKEITKDSEDLDEKYYTLTATGNGFTLGVDVKALQTAAETNVGKKIVVKYSATVNENAVSVISKNRAVLTYSNDPTNADEKTTQTVEETVYSAKVVIDKYAKNENNEADTSTKLAGAKFVLAKYEAADGSIVKKEVADGDSSIIKKFYKYTEGAAGQPGKVEWVEKQEDASEYETNTQGATEFKGLKNGSYYLLETKAPDGYNLLSGEVGIEIAGGSATETALGALTHTEGVANSTGAILPGTGGIGTTIFYAAGIILMAGAVFFVVRRKRA